MDSARDRSSGGTERPTFARSRSEARRPTWNAPSTGHRSSPWSRQAWMFAESESRRRRGKSKASASFVSKLRVQSSERGAAPEGALYPAVDFVIQSRSRFRKLLGSGLIGSMEQRFRVPKILGAAMSPEL